MEEEETWGECKRVVKFFYHCETGKFREIYLFFTVLELKKKERKKKIHFDIASNLLENVSSNALSLNERSIYILIDSYDRVNIV